MKTKQEIISMMMGIIAELESGTVKEGSPLEVMLKVKLETLYDILGDDTPEEYWERIENLIY